jgi:hypothetical protein
VQKRDVALPQAAFRRMLTIERKRSERTGRPLALLLIDTEGARAAHTKGRILRSMVTVLQPFLRETDEAGWYEANVAFGILFTEVAADSPLPVSAILGRVQARLRGRLEAGEFEALRFRCHLYPDEWERQAPGWDQGLEEGKGRDEGRGKQKEKEEEEVRARGHAVGGAGRSSEKSSAAKVFAVSHKIGFGR